MKWRTRTLTSIDPHYFKKYYGLTEKEAYEKAKRILLACKAGSADLDSLLGWDECVAAIMNYEDEMPQLALDFNVERNGWGYLKMFITS